MHEAAGMEPCPALYWRWAAQALFDNFVYSFIILVSEQPAVKLQCKIHAGIFHLQLVLCSGDFGWRTAHLDADTIISGLRECKQRTKQSDIFGSKIPFDSYIIIFIVCIINNRNEYVYIKKYHHSFILQKLMEEKVLCYMNSYHEMRNYLINIKMHS